MPPTINMNPAPPTAPCRYDANGYTSNTHDPMTKITLLLQTTIDTKKYMTSAKREIACTMYNNK